MPMRLSLIAIMCTGLLIGASVEAQDDDVDPLAELAELGDALADDGPEGGGSIRAKKDADLTRSKRIKDPNNFEAKVDSVKGAKFPLVAIRLKITKPAKKGAGKALKRNQQIVIYPKLKVSGGKVALEDGATLINAGAFYLQKGDKVVVRLGTQKGKLWEAEYIERK